MKTHKILMSIILASQVVSVPMLCQKPVKGVYIYGVAGITPKSIERASEAIARGFAAGSQAVKENSSTITFGLATTFLLCSNAYRLSNLCWDYVGKKVLESKPTVLLPDANIGRTDRFKRWWNNYQTPRIIFPQVVEERLQEIVQKTKISKMHIKNGKNVTYDNMLLYGPPGTGKTLFAHVLADQTDMDFAPTTAAALLQKDAGVKYLNELVDMAKRSKYGVLIFIDEADALFVNRDLLDPSSEHYQVLNHLLALTGDGSNKFMLVAATNHAQVMDEAMGRRFQDQVCMPLPDVDTRAKVFELYVNKVLRDTNNGQAFIQAVDALLTEDAVAKIVEDTDGLSSAEIKDVVYAMHKKAMATDAGIITDTHITRAVKEAVEKSYGFKDVMHQAIVATPA